jgi:O-antigen ligase
MTASGLAMGVLVLGVARLSVSSAPLRRPGAGDVQALALILALLAALTFSKRASLFPVEGERLFVAALAAAAAALPLLRGGWPGTSLRPTLGLVACFLCAWSLALSRTRNAWLGTLAGLGTIAALRAPRALLLLPAGIAALLIVRPPQLIERLTLRDASSIDRYYMWQAGIDMVLDKPVFGQGPGMVPLLYSRYRWPEAPNAAAPHLHDNFIQIAAERGLPCLAFYLWLLFVLLRDAWRAARDALSSEARERGVPALAVIVAVIVAGAFEYNFGDSEVLMFTLLVSALPYSQPEEPVCG